MNSKRVKVDAADIRPGMFVALLDRSWLETPFVVRGFEVRNNEEVDQLRRYCKHVFVDPARSSIEPSAITALSESGRSPVSLTGDQNYPRLTAFSDETRPAHAAYVNAINLMGSVFERAQAGGGVDADTARRAVCPLITSVLRNPDALAFCASLQKQHGYRYNHAISSSVWGIIFGAHLGLDRGCLEKLGLGCMLLDIGKIHLHQELLKKPDKLVPHEAAQMVQHVEYGIDIVGKTRGFSPDVLEMIELHHERYDGSGYPHGYSGARIPVFARIAGIVDSFDAMLSERPYAEARSPHAAMRELNRVAGVLFERELVEQFVQAIGTFPAGSVVELSSGEIAVVLEQNREHRLRPRVVIVRTADGRRAREPESIDLASDEYLSGPEARFIEGGREPGDCGVNPEAYFR